MHSPIQPFVAAYYSSAFRAQLNRLAQSDLDSAQSIWGRPDQSFAFRNVLVGSQIQKRDSWHSWFSNGVFEMANQQAIYILCQRFVHLGKVEERWGILASIPIHHPAIIIHEDVVAEGVERARQATEACEADIAPIFVGFDEKKVDPLRDFLRDSVKGQASLCRFFDEQNGEQSHELWEMKDSAAIAYVQQYLETEKLFILDGHHRLAAAKANHAQGLGDGNILACVCSLDARDTLILPIHRLVHYRPWMLLESLQDSFRRLGAQISPGASISSSNFEKQLTGLNLTSNSCMALNAHNDQWIRIDFRAPIAELAMPLRDLAVAQLEYYLSHRFGAATVMPVAHPNLALEQLAVDQAQVAFFLPPLRAEQVKTVALAGLRLPRKSTRFVPKPALGLITRPWGALL